MRYFLFCFVLLGIYSCKNELDDNSVLPISETTLDSVPFLEPVDPTILGIIPDSFISTPGKIPESINQVVDIFELKYGEVKEFTYNGQVFDFSIAGIVDSVLMDLYYSVPSPFVVCDPVYQKIEIRIHTYFQVTIDENTMQFLKVSSNFGGGLRYKNDGSDLQEIKTMLDTWQQHPEERYPFRQEFFRYFCDGTSIEDTPLSIYIAKSYAKIQHRKEDINAYKFIFIITD